MRIYATTQKWYKLRLIAKVSLPKAHCQRFIAKGSLPKAHCQRLIAKGFITAGLKPNARLSQIPLP